METSCLLSPNYRTDYTNFSTFLATLYEGGKKNVVLLMVCNKQVIEWPLAVSIFQHAQSTTVIICRLRGLSAVSTWHIPTALLIAHWSNNFALNRYFRTTNSEIIYLSTIMPHWIALSLQDTINKLISNVTWNQCSSSILWYN